MPYIEHPIAVAELLADHGYGEETIAAALLHDVVEDSDTSIEDVESRFGERIGAMVAAMTDQEAIEPYERRKAEHRKRVEAADGDTLAIFAADKLTNVKTLRRAYAQYGETVGEEFKAPLEAKEAVWRGDLEMLRRAAPELPFLDELDAELSALYEERSEQVA